MDTKRLTLATMLALVATLMFGAAPAQQTPQSSKAYRIGVLVNSSNPHPAVEALRAGMAQLGYVKGTNVIYEARYPEGKLERLPGFAAELVAVGVDVIVAFGGPPTNAARKASSTSSRSKALAPSETACPVAKIWRQAGRTSKRSKKMR